MRHATVRSFICVDLAKYMTWKCEEKSDHAILIMKGLVIPLKREKRRDRISAVFDFIQKLTAILCSVPPDATGIG